MTSYRSAVPADPTWSHSLNPMDLQGPALSGQQPDGWHHTPGLLPGSAFQVHLPPPGLPVDPTRRVALGPLFQQSSAPSPIPCHPLSDLPPAPCPLWTFRLSFSGPAVRPVHCSAQPLAISPVPGEGGGRSSTQASGSGELACSPSGGHTWQDPTATWTCSSLGICPFSQ